MADSGQERTEQPTEKRKREARNKGTVVKSVDLVGAAVFMALLMTLPGVMNRAGQGIIQSVHGSLTTIPTEVSGGQLARAFYAAAMPLLPGLLMLVAVAMVVGVGMNLGQVGFHLSAQALVPSFAKINPAAGIKKLFSKVAVFDAAKSLGKAMIFGYIAWSVLQSRWIELSNSWQLTPYGTYGLIGDVARSILIKIGMTWLVIAGLDYLFQKKQVESQLKMTKDEVRQEMKDAETSPELKQAMAAKRRALSKKRTAAAVKSADVIITNPTHFAIAIKYQPDKHFAPQVVAKGVDLNALKIREIAKEARVPIVENKPLARALYKQCEVGDFVPRELFQSVAEVLAYVYRTLKKVR